MGGHDHPKHWHCAIFEPDQGAKPIPIPEEMWRQYEEDRELTRSTRTPTRKLTASGDPLFYLLDGAGKLVFFGPTMMFRLPYERVPRDFVPEALRGDEVTDLAEAIFGYVPESKADKRAAYASRVFFNDAVLVPQEGHRPLADAPITPKILSGPKPTSFQHYLTQRNPDNRHRLDHYAESPQNTAIRGHKLYWHRGPTSLDDVKETAQVSWQADPDNPNSRPDSQHTQIRPVTEGTQFTFRVDFENLSEVELGALLWALEPAGAEGQEFCHKLGMGKPLGMGAVKLEPTLHLSTRQDRYRTLLDDGGWNLAEKPEPDRARFKKAFEAYILARIPADRKGAQALKDVPRLKHLLAMLAWPGPDPALTPYAGYQDRTRKVLPTPLGVLGQPDGAPAPGEGGHSPQPSPVQGRRVGKVKRFDAQKGYGFITQPSGADIFVHISEVEGGAPLAVDQRVSYEIGSSPKGPRAVRVCPE